MVLNLMDDAALAPPVLFVLGKNLPLDHPACFAVLMIDEGGELDMSYDDSGNWTSGEVGVGDLTGSRWGISSASYPDIDKETLTRDAAEAIYLRDYWAKVLCDDLPPQIRFLVYSSAVNSGLGWAGFWLQTAVTALGCSCGALDGEIGAKTVQAAAKANPALLMAEFSAQRLCTVSSDAIFAIDRMGLSRRIVNDALTAALPAAV